MSADHSTPLLPQTGVKLAFITNAEKGHQTALSAVLGSTDEARVAVAFLRRDGAKFLAGELRKGLGRGGNAEVFVGTDFCLTEPDALQTLLALADEFAALEIFIGAASAATFHPKVYAGFGKDLIQCVTGSANLTGGALGRNFEASIWATAEPTSEFAIGLAGMFGSLRSSDRFRVLDPVNLAQYRSIWWPVDRERKRLERALALAKQSLFDGQTLTRLFSEYQTDKQAQLDVANRAKNRKRARKVQRAIANLGETEPTAARRKRMLRSHLQDLMSGAGNGRHLWSSDAIYRRGSEAYDHPEAMISLFNRAREASKDALTEGFNKVAGLAEDIPGVGVNMVTEIMNTFAPGRYPVVNGNTKKALAHLGITFPGALQLGKFKSPRYAEVAGYIAAIRDRVGAADFAETDAFLNYVYVRTKKRGRS